MSEAKCLKCSGSAFGDTYEQAKNNINHAVGLGRGIKCGDSYGCVTEIKPKQPTSKVVTEKPVETKPTESPKSEIKKSTTKKYYTKKEKYL